MFDWHKMGQKWLRCGNCSGAVVELDGANEACLGAGEGSRLYGHAYQCTPCNEILNYCRRNLPLYFESAINDTTAGASRSCSISWTTWMSQSELQPA